MEDSHCSYFVSCVRLLSFPIFHSTLRTASLFLIPSAQRACILEFLSIRIFVPLSQCLLLLSVLTKPLLTVTVVLCLFVLLTSIVRMISLNEDCHVFISRCDA